MKIAIGIRPREGPWGGGNQFAASLTRFLQAKGHDVRFALDAPDLDVILLTEPRRSSASSAFNDADIWAYLTRTNARALVVHRVNECDERKNTRLVNARLAIANRCADETVFVSDWLRGLFRDHGYRFRAPSAILNGADRAVFHQNGGPSWPGSGRLKLVTHHFSDNRMKGFDIYARLDALLARPEFGDQYEFTYVGRLPPGVTLPHTRVVPPLAQPALAEELGRHHVYLTASRNEPGGMHPVEGALSGLPLLYRRSGSLPEYCDGFGVAFDEGSFETSLLEVRNRYVALRARMGEYPHDAQEMCGAYERLFARLVTDRNAVLARRPWRRMQAAGWRTTARLYDRWYSATMRFEAAMRRQR